MKFDVVDPNDEQAILDEEGTGEGDREATDAPGTPEEPPRPGVHPLLVQASQRMHTRLSADLATLGASLHRLHAHVEIARSREAADEPVAPPPANFRAHVFSRPPAP